MSSKITKIPLGPIDLGFDENRANHLEFQGEVSIKEIDIGSHLPLVGKYLNNDSLNIKRLGMSTGIDLHEAIHNKANFELNANLELEIASQTLTAEVPLYIKTLLPSEEEISSEDASKESKKPAVIPIQKKIGPLNLSSMSLDLRDSDLLVTCNINLDASVIKFDFYGLGAYIPLIDFSLGEVEFNLDGVGVVINAGPLSAGGSLIREVDEYENKFYGTLLLKIKNFAFNMIGAYQEEDFGNSMFAFGVVDYPIGGDPSFFITGAAFGIGYNRELIRPNINHVQKFPLIEYAIGTETSKDNNLSEIVKSFDEYSPITPGQYWIAAGIKFKSYEFTTGVALLTATFGNRLEFDLLGVANLAIYKNADEKSNPLVKVGLNLKAVVAPDEGLFSLEAAVTPNSYVLSEDCKLTGGLAYYMWYSPSRYAGDFVFTLGGYHPKYTKPAHYPTVDRLGLNWRVDKSTNIEGNVYFAITPNCLMFGGRMEAVYRKANISAEFNMYFDALIVWKPVYYQIDAGVYIHVEADLLLWHPSITVNVDVSIWGPEFGGKAEISVSFASIYIYFGAKKNDKPIILGSWEEFQKVLVSSKEEICSINIVDGLVKKDKESVQYNNSIITTEQKTENDIWIVNPETFSFATSSKIPINEFEFEEEVNHKKDKILKECATDPFDIGMLGWNNVTTKKTITIEKISSFLQSSNRKESVTDQVSSIHLKDLCKDEIRKAPPALWDNVNEESALTVEAKNRTFGKIFGFDVFTPDKTTEIESNVLLYQCNDPIKTKNIFDVQYISETVIGYWTSQDLQNLKNNTKREEVINDLQEYHFTEISSQINNIDLSMFYSEPIKRRISKLRRNNNE